MSSTPIVTVQISLQSPAQTRTGFGTGLFVSRHRRWSEVIRTYTSITSVAVDFETTDPAYLAAQNYFSATPSAPKFKIGRENSDVTLVPQSTIVGGEIFSFQFAGGGSDVTVTYTAIGGDTEADVVTGLIADMDSKGLTNNVDPLDDKVTASGTTTLILSEVNAIAFAVTNVSTTLTESTTSDSTQTAADLVTLMDQEDPEWYFYMHDNHEASFVQATASAILALEKMYFYSTQDLDALGTIGNPIEATDIGALLQATSNDRVVGLWHNLANTAYYESAYVGLNAPFDAGSVNWANLPLNGVPAPLNPTTGKSLTTTEVENICSRDLNVQQAVGSKIVVRIGVTAGGESIRVIRGRDSMGNDIRVAVCNLLTTQQGTTLVFDDNDINRFKAVITNELQRYNDRKFILDDFVVIVPLAQNVPDADKAANLLTGLEFTANIARAIKSAEVNGILIG